MCRRNACAGILLPVGTVEKGPAHQLILFDKGPDRPRLYVSAWRRCLCLIPALKKVDLVGKRRGHACRRQFLYGRQHTPCWADTTTTTPHSPHPASSTPNKHPHPSHLPDHTRASRRHKYSFHKSCQICILLPDNVQKLLSQNFLFSVLSATLYWVKLKITVHKLQFYLYIQVPRNSYS